MDALRRVVWVGGVSDTEAVLKAVFEPRGAKVERSLGRPESNLTAGTAPQVVVIDLDTQPDSETATQSWQQSSRILIGSHQPERISGEDRFLAKPFQFPELVRVIEGLLEARPAA